MKKIHIANSDKTVTFYNLDVIISVGYRVNFANRIDEELENNDAKEILKIIGEYSKALDLLDDYDHKTLKKIRGNVDERKIE